MPSGYLSELKNRLYCLLFPTLIQSLEMLGSPHVWIFFHIFDCDKKLSDALRMTISH